MSSGRYVRALEAGRGVAARHVCAVMKRWDWRDVGEIVAGDGIHFGKSIAMVSGGIDRRERERAVIDDIRTFMAFDNPFFLPPKLCRFLQVRYRHRCQWGRT
jgi:hypothetical protein